MNDLERDLRNVLDEDARRVPTPTSAPEGLRRSVRRRQAVFGSLVGLSALAIVAGIVAGATMLLPFRSDTQPVGEGPKTTGTLNGIMITYPAAWNLVDPDEAGLNGPGPSTLPRIVLALSPHPASSAIACPGMTDGEPPTFLMTVQEAPLAAEARSMWPASLEPMNQATSESGCYPDWEFLRAGWTIADRTFEARVGFAPDASDDDREALFAAFASMTFAASPEGITSVTLTTGSAGGQEWSLIATREDDGLGLTLQGESSGAGIGAFDGAPQGLQIGSNAFGTGADRELVIFGAVPSGVVRVEASSAGSPVVSVDVLDVPTKIDPDLDAFALVVPAERVELRGYDEAGDVVVQGTAGGDEPPLTSAGSALEDGRHFGYVRSVDVDGGAIEFDLAYFLSGEEANQAYQEATGDSGPVPNDHFVVNDNPMLRTLTLAPDARLRLLDWNNCCDTFFDGELALFAEAIGEQADVTDGDLIYRGQSQWWITVENGVVTEIEEQYSP